MKKSHFLLSGIFISIILLYTALWFFVTNAMVGGMKEAYKDRSDITFKNITSCGFPFKFGVKLDSFALNNDGTTLYSGDATFGYNLLRQGIFISCDIDSMQMGRSIAFLFGPKPKDMKLSFSNHVRLPLSPSLIKILLSEDRHFEIVNLIKYLDGDCLVDIRDSETKDLVLNGSAKMNVDIDNKSYYKSFDEMVGDTTPALYNVTVVTDSNSPVAKQFSGKYNINYKVTTPFKNALANMHVLINTDGYNLISKSNSSFEFLSKFDENYSVGDLAFKIKGEAHLKDGYFDFLNEMLLKYASEALSEGVSPAVSHILQDIVDHPDKYKLEYVKMDKQTFNLDASVNVNNGKYKLYVKELDLMMDDTGISLQNESEFTKKFDWSTKGLLSVKNYDSAFHYYSRYITRAFPEEFNEERVDIIGKALGSFLRNVSNHPESQNPEIILSYEGDSNISNIKIGGNDETTLAAIYKKALYDQAAEKVKQDPNFLGKIGKILPEISSDTNLLNSLQKLAPNAASSTSSVIDALDKIPGAK